MEPVSPQPPAETDSSTPEPAPPVALEPPPDVPASSKRWLWLVLTAAILIISGLVYWYAIRSRDETAVNSFDECVAAGYPVAESFPEQCIVPGGPSFTRP